MQILGGEEGSEGKGQQKMRNKKNRYGMPKISGRRFRVERMNIFGVRSTTEFAIDEVREISCHSVRKYKILSTIEFMSKCYLYLRT